MEMVAFEFLTRHFEISIHVGIKYMHRYYVVGKNRKLEGQQYDKNPPWKYKGKLLHIGIITYSYKN